MTDAELFARLGQLLDVIEGLRQEMRDGFAAADRRAAKIEADVSELRADVSGLKADVSGLKAEVSELRADVSGLKAEVSGVKGELVVVNKRLAALENEMVGIKQAQALTLAAPGKRFGGIDVNPPLLIRQYWTGVRLYTPGRPA